MRAERINTISRIVNAKSYLEIGVGRGDTFFQVENEYKVGVDPRFQFDFKAKENERTKFYELKSDDFFRLLSGEKFDMIYIDGLHTFEQTLRDFLIRSFSHMTKLFGSLMILCRMIIFLRFPIKRAATGDGAC